jgi:hypothetical protein
MSSCTCFVVQLSASGSTASLVRSHSYVLTCALANNNPPPMGANMIPMAKNNGRTVLGVRIGLRYCQMGLREGFQSRHLLPCLQSLLTESSICKEAQSISP